MPEFPAVSVDWDSLPGEEKKKAAEEWKKKKKKKKITLFSHDSERKKDDEGFRSEGGQCGNESSFPANLH